MKIQEIIEKLENFHPQVGPRTCDCVKIGDPSQECTGIVITTFASMEVIRKTIDAGANFIICHEPVFYNHEDKVDWLEKDPVYDEKRGLLIDNNIVIYRDHDHIHGGHGDATDGIFYGIMNELGWKDYLIGDIKKPLLYEIPETSLSDLAAFLMDKLNITGMRVVGSQDFNVRRVFMCEHVNASAPRAWGGNNPTMDPDSEKILYVRDNNVDVCISFEIVDWTLSTYVRDSCSNGRPRAILEMGHFNTEELGMRYMLKYLPRVIGEDIPTQYIQSGDSFSYIVR